MNASFDEDALLPISALQHFRFCNRRAALVHTEGLWAENQFTQQGNVLHQKAHDAQAVEHRPGLRVVRGMQLRSLTLGLFGKADVLELHDAPRRAVLIEYKRGKPRPHLNLEFKIQLCAQVMCLEESLPDLPVEAAIYYGQARRRERVDIDAELRQLTLDTARQLHELIASRQTPAARYMRRKCERCSMRPLCMPNALRVRATASCYLVDVIHGDAGAQWKDAP